MRSDCYESCVTCALAALCPQDINVLNVTKGGKEGLQVLLGYVPRHLHPCQAPSARDALLDLIPVSRACMC